MNCLTNISRITYSTELVHTLIKLYKFNGRDAFYKEALKKNMDSYTKPTVEKDLIFAARILDLSITESRIKAIIKRDSEAKTQDEQILVNLKKIFKIIIDKGRDLNLDSNEFLSMASTLYENTKIRVKFNTKTVMVSSIDSLLEEPRKVSDRIKLDDELQRFKTVVEKEHIEPVQAITNLYVDLLNMKVFDRENEFLALLICYSLLVYSGFEVFRYTSFFELYYVNKNSFDMAIARASYNWEKGFSETEELNRILLNFLISGYEKVEKIIDNIDFDKNLSKKDLIASIILKLPKVFTRADIQKASPAISDSTINRALEELKAEGKIMSNGVGRSATWTRTVPDDMFSTSARQMDIFAYCKED